MSDKPTQWVPLCGGGHAFKAMMDIVLVSGGTNFDPGVECIAGIPTYAVQCLKCQKIHAFSTLIASCKNCNNRAYIFAGVPQAVEIACGKCGETLLETVTCDCGCKNALTALTMKEPQKSGTCFVATAACGDPFAPEVIVLSAFRDDVLSASGIGRAFIRLYNAVSPPIAAVIARSGALRRAAMVLIVRPAVRLVRVPLKGERD
jgi:hypothetical protein